MVTALVDNEVGRLLEDLMLQGGVDLRYLQWVADDGIGRRVRNGLNFTERGFGVRGALGVSDRGHSAASQLTVGSMDWRGVFGEDGTRWFHTGGIFASLSDSTAEFAIEACTEARRHGAIVSYDLNYRPSLWKDRGGVEGARAVNRRIAPLVDVMIGNEEDFATGLGIDAGNSSELLEGERDFARMVNEAVAEFPNFKLVATTLRGVTSATVNDWSAVCWHDGRRLPLERLSCDRNPRSRRRRRQLCLGPHLWSSHRPVSTNCSQSRRCPRCSGDDDRWRQFNGFTRRSCEARRWRQC